MDPNYGSYDGGNGIKSKILEFIQTVVVFAAIGTAIYLFVAQPHKVSGSSMNPTLTNGNYIITNKIGYRIGEPKRGDIIVFKNPREETQDFIKRIIGLPGDRVKLQNGKVYLNGNLLEEPYLNPNILTTPGSFLKDATEIVVTDNHYIVFGDNRIASSDSREWGFITKDEIIGKTFFRYWPLDSIGVVFGFNY